jgi:hypothetical protein
VLCAFLVFGVVCLVVCVVFVLGLCVWLMKCVLRQVMSVCELNRFINGETVAAALVACTPGMEACCFACCAVLCCGVGSYFCLSQSCFKWMG